MTPDGFKLLPAELDAQQQAELVKTVLALSLKAPFSHYETPGGAQMSVAMTSLGAVGWVSDRKGYRYQPRHPGTGQPWPAMPESLLTLWRRVTDKAPDPDSCLLNLYRDGARMGLHQDRDEQDLSAPVLSISLGDTALFRIGGLTRKDATRSVRLASGDVCILDGEARLAFHGVDRIISQSSRLIPGGGRLNLTLRRARSR